MEEKPSKLETIDKKDRYYDRSWPSLKPSSQVQKQSRFLGPIAMDYSNLTNHNSKKGTGYDKTINLLLFHLLNFRKLLKERILIIY